MSNGKNQTYKYKESLKTMYLKSPILSSPICSLLSFTLRLRHDLDHELRLGKLAPLTKKGYLFRIGSILALMDNIYSTLC